MNGRRLVRDVADDGAETRDGGVIVLAKALKIGPEGIIDLLRQVALCQTCKTASQDGDATTDFFLVALALCFVFAALAIDAQARVLGGSFRTILLDSGLAQDVGHAGDLADFVGPRRSINGGRNIAFRNPVHAAPNRIQAEHDVARLPGDQTAGQQDGDGTDDKLDEDRLLRPIDCQLDLMLLGITGGLGNQIEHALDTRPDRIDLIVHLVEFGFRGTACHQLRQCFTGSLVDFVNIRGKRLHIDLQAGRSDKSLDRTQAFLQKFGILVQNGATFRRNCLAAPVNDNVHGSQTNLFVGKAQIVDLLVDDVNFLRIGERAGD